MVRGSRKSFFNDRGGDADKMLVFHMVNETFHHAGAIGL